MEEELWYSEKYQNCLRDMGLLLSRLIPALSRYERITMKDLGFTPSQATLMLTLLQQPGIAMGELARILGLDESTLTRNAGILIRDDMLEKTRDPEDRRVYRLDLTPGGKNRAVEIRDRIHGLYRKVMEKLPKGHVREVMAAVEMLAASLDASLGEWGSV